MFEKFKEKFKSKELSGTELMLIGCCMFFTGFVLGMLLSPKGSRKFFCENGTHCGNNYCADSLDKSENEQ